LKSVAVAIGIAHAGSLPELPGAVNGAKKFCDWAKQQGYEVHLVSDETAEVTVEKLKTLIKDIIDEGETERLVIYFAGHGIQPSYNTAYWLLSRWDNDSDEAINFNLSFANAKRSAIDQIAVFGDACRSTVPDAASVGGSSIFPKAAASKIGQPQWDQFLACRLGDSAQEVAASDATKAYGIFTRCVLRALSGDEGAAIDNRPGQQPSRAVTSDTLAIYLKKAVPLESGKIPGAVVQFPDLSPGWISPKDVYLGLTGASQDVTLEKFGRVPASASNELSDMRLPEGRSEKPSKPRASKRAQAAVAKAELLNEKAVETNKAIFAAAQGRESFETGHGLTIIGGHPTSIAHRKGSDADLFKEGGNFHIRAHGNKPLPILIKVERGNWIGACTLPNFVGTIVVKDGLAASVNYAPARYGPYQRQSFEEVAPLLARWTALMHQGRFGDLDELKKLGDQLRQYKHVNPSLGILAAYAYERAGDLKAIDSVATYFAQAEQPIPFDVALLSTKEIARSQQGLTIKATGQTKTPVAGSFPLMTQGWSFLDPDDKFVTPAMMKLRQGLLPSLWTTLREKEGKQLAKLIHEGKL
jgi:Caspase domain